MANNKNLLVLANELTMFITTPIQISMTIKSLRKTANTSDEINLPSTSPFHK